MASIGRSRGQAPDNGFGHDTWHVYTDGTSRHERRQTFSGWAARALQLETRQVRQASGASPGGTSLDAETQAVLIGLRLVPAGAVARLYSDLDLTVLLGVLGRPEGEAARSHLRDLWVHVVARTVGRHPRDVHQASRAAEHDAREDGPPGGSGLPNVILDALDLARSREADEPVALRVPHHLPGTSGPLRVHVRGVTDVDPAMKDRIHLTLEITGSPSSVVRSALARTLASLTHGSLLDLHASEPWREVVADAARELSLVRLVELPEE